MLHISMLFHLFCFSNVLIVQRVCDDVHASLYFLIILHSSVFLLARLCLSMLFNCSAGSTVCSASLLNLDIELLILTNTHSIHSNILNLLWLSELVWNSTLSSLKHHLSSGLLCIITFLVPYLPLDANLYSR